MTHDELLAELNKDIDQTPLVKDYYPIKALFALRAVVELHKPKFYPAGCKDETCCPEFFACENCGAYYPCSTIQTIEKEGLE